MFVKPPMGFSADFTAAGIQDKAVAEEHAYRLAKEAQERRTCLDAIHDLSLHMPPEDPYYNFYLYLRKQPLYQEQITDALKKIKLQIVKHDGSWEFDKTVLICMDDSQESTEGFEVKRNWVSDLKNDLRMVKVRAQTIDDALSGTYPYKLMDQYYGCKNLPDLMVTVGTESLPKVNSQTGEVWGAAIEGAIKAKRKLFPLLLSGDRQQFWPASTSEDRITELMTSYPVARKSYHAALFDLIKQLYRSESQIREHEKIVQEFEGAVGPLLKSCSEPFSNGSQAKELEKQLKEASDHMLAQLFKGGANYGASY